MIYFYLKKEQIFLGPYMVVFWILNFYLKKDKFRESLFKF